MNAITKEVFKGTIPIIAAIAASLASVAYAQNSLQFTGVKATDERAIQLRWRSNSNAVYRLEYAPELSSEIVWDALVDLFPAQGTNTMFLDTDNDSDDPSEILFRRVQVFP